MKDEAQMKKGQVCLDDGRGESAARDYYAGSRKLLSVMP